LVSGVRRRKSRRSARAFASALLRHADPEGNEAEREDAVAALAGTLCPHGVNPARAACLECVIGRIMAPGGPPVGSLATGMIAGALGYALVQMMAPKKRR